MWALEVDTLGDSKRTYSTYDKEFHAILRCLKRLSHYLIASESIIHFDHEPLKYIRYLKGFTHHFL